MIEVIYNFQLFFVIFVNLIANVDDIIRTIVHIVYITYMYIKGVTILSDPIKFLNSLIRCKSIRFFLLK